MNTIDKAFRGAVITATVCMTAMVLWIGYGLQVSSPPTIEVCQLHNATRQGQVHTVQKLLREGADVQQHDLLGRSTLHIAACEGTPTVLSCLLEQKQTKVAALDNYQRTPLHWVAKNPRAQEMIDKLLQQGIDVNAQDRFGMTALHLAAKHGNLQCVKKLIKEGAGIRTYDRFGNTPYTWALVNKHKKVAALLKK
ncbi:MAG: ankyrin repeat domain-containing protein [Myxococcota bacterium]